MPRIALLQGEKILAQISPHPVSFWPHYFPWLFTVFWGALYHPVIGVRVFSPTAYYGIWLLGLAVVALVAAYYLIHWSIALVFAIVVVFGVSWVPTWNMSPVGAVFTYSLIVGLLGIFAVEIWRRTHRFTLTSYRIISSAGILTTKERTLRYGDITDTHVTHEILGRIFGYATIIPVTASGFGLGGDESFTAALLGTSKKVHGVPIAVGGMIGGGRDVRVARARTHDCLFGVHPFKDTAILVQQQIQGHQPANLSHQQTGALQRIEDYLKRLIKSP